MTFADFYAVTILAVAQIESARAFQFRIARNNETGGKHLNVSTAGRSIEQLPRRSRGIVAQLSQNGRLVSSGVCCRAFSVTPTRDGERGESLLAERFSCANNSRLGAPFEYVLSRFR